MSKLCGMIKKSSRHRSDNFCSKSDKLTNFSRFVNEIFSNLFLGHLWPTVDYKYRLLCFLLYLGLKWEFSLFHLCFMLIAIVSRRTMGFTWSESCHENSQPYKRTKTMCGGSTIAAFGKSLMFLPLVGYSKSNGFQTRFNSLLYA